MNPRLDDKERELQQRARRAAATVGAAAASIDAGESEPRGLMRELAAAGCLAIHIAEPHGGGAGLVGAALVAEELGAASAAVADVVIAHWAALSLIEALGSEEQTQTLMPALAAGDQLATLVLDGAVSLLDDPAVSMTAQRENGRLRMRGTAGAVSGAMPSDLLIMPATLEDRLVAGIVAADADRVERVAVGRRLGLNGAGAATVALDDVDADPLQGGDTRAVLEAVADLQRIGHASLCVGIGRAALEISTAHVAGTDGLDRSQSVQWMLADMATETEAARVLTWYAATRSKAAERREAAAMARLLAADAAVAAGRRAVQIFGAAGTDPAVGVERLFRDAKAMEVHHGASEAQRAQVARQLLPDLFE